MFQSAYQVVVIRVRLPCEARLVEVLHFSGFIGACLPKTSACTAGSDANETAWGGNMRWTSVKKGQLMLLLQSYTPAWRAPPEKCNFKLWHHRPQELLIVCSVASHFLLRLSGFSSFAAIFKFQSRLLFLRSPNFRKSKCWSTSVSSNSIKIAVPKNPWKM